MMNHKLHIYVMGGALLIGAVLLFTGTGGASPFLILIVACMVMMFFMMRGMGAHSGMGGKDRHESDHAQHPQPKDPQDHAPTPR